MELKKYLAFISLFIVANMMITLTSAQSVPGVSKTCSDGITQLLGDQDLNACMPLATFLPLASGNITEAQLTQMGDKICGLNKCSDSVITKTRNSVEQACSSELSASSPNGFVLLADFLLTYYSPLRDSACLKNPAGGYCFVESYHNIQSSNLNPLSPDFITTYLQQPTSVVCTDCNKKIASNFFNYQAANPDTTKRFSTQTNTVKSQLQNKCGNDFTNGPSTTQSSTTSQKSDSSIIKVDFALLLSINLSILILLISKRF